MSRRFVRIAAAVLSFLILASVPAAPAVPPCYSVAGDLSGDCLIDGDDLQAFVDCVIVGTTPTGTCGCADLNADDVINSADVGILVDTLLGRYSPRWSMYGGTPQHVAISRIASQPLERIRWQTPVDLDPQYSGTVLYVHYGTPLATAANTIVLPVKTGQYDGFRVEGRRGADGQLVWSFDTDYSLPAHGWVPGMGCAIRPDNMVAMPGAGGTVYLRDADAPNGTVYQFAFYGIDAYITDPAPFNENVRVSTPITADRNGNIFFGFVVTGPTPLNLSSGLARISSTGNGSWTTGAAAANDIDMQKVAYNCAPAISNDGNYVYVAVNNINGSGFGFGYLVQVDSSTLAHVSRVLLKDNGFPDHDAYIPDDGTASPMVGPDGDVYFGVLEQPFAYNHIRGWMLHFSADLSQTKLAGAFGWDDTASVVPACAVPGYTGPSSYLLLTKYNNYAEGGGTGVNKVGVLDPNVPMLDPISNSMVMNEVLTIAGPSPDPHNRDQFHPDAVREWCINTAAVDPLTKSALVNNEDGVLYRWDFTTDTLSQAMVLTAGIGEAYTPTMIGPDGTVYAINNAILFAVGANP